MSPAAGYVPSVRRRKRTQGFQILQALVVVGRQPENDARRNVLFWEGVVRVTPRRSPCHPSWFSVSPQGCRQCHLSFDKSCQSTA